jgi:hypothetical protein
LRGAVSVRVIATKEYTSTICSCDLVKPADDWTTGTNTKIFLEDLRAVSVHQNFDSLAELSSSDLGILTVLFGMLSQKYSFIETLSKLMSLRRIARAMDWIF